MPSFTLTDVAHDLWVESFAMTGSDAGLPASGPWSVVKRRLRGGRRDGVDLIQVDNGALAVSVVPTRGMGIWKGQFGGRRLGWDSPIADGPVHPGFVNPLDGGGLGWLEGFDELLARCGLETNGAPYEVRTVLPDGSESHTTYPLHGKVANLPAHFVAVHVAEEPPHAITVEGHVDEARPFGPRLRMVARLTTTPGSNRLVVRDEFTNLGDSPAEMVVLYHWNFGPPHLDPGARLVAPVRTVAPRDPRAAEGIGHYDVYGGAEPGFAEQVYYLELLGLGEEGRSLAMLRNAAGEEAVVLRFRTTQLPAFTLWKCTRGPQEGYVTGLEPATNYPNPTPIEKARGRVVTLAPEQTFVVETALEVLDTRQAVAEVEEEVGALQSQGAPTIHPAPVEPFVPAG
jgi:Domain of unknown function (DUF4432)